jgi:hypothetical protein
MITCKEKAYANPLPGTGDAKISWFVDLENAFLCLFFSDTTTISFLEVDTL